MSFKNLKLIEPLQKSLQEEGYTTPTPIQQEAIPIILARKDLLGCAQTGTGKTAAFALPILQILNKIKANETTGRKKIKVLIVTPTRELAVQIGDSFAVYGKYLRLEHTVVFGGVSYLPQRSALKRGVDILIATTGRLIDLINEGCVDLSSLEIFVLDEADRMLDMGFIHDIKRILRVIPKQRQSLFFSATMPSEIVKLAEGILSKPEKVEVTPVSSTADTIQQAVYFVDKQSKRDLLIHVLKDKKIESALVFTRTKHGADKVTRLLRDNNIKAEAIHGNKSQNNRQMALNNFKNKETRVLVATDIAARGIDIDDLSHVINYEIPNIPETYVHRIGRTGRAGANGIALSFCDSEEKFFLRDIHKLISKTIPVIEEHPFPINTNPSEVVEKAPERRPTTNTPRNNAPRREPIKTERDFKKPDAPSQRSTSGRSAEKNRSFSSKDKVYSGESRTRTDREMSESRTSKSYRGAKPAETRRTADSFASAEKPKRKWFGRPR